jgi:hypothetical protein
MHVMQCEILHCTWWSVGRYHAKTKKKKIAVQNKASNNSISNYLCTMNISEMEKQLPLAAPLHIIL